jgi:hypothetical protein
MMGDLGLLFPHREPGELLRNGTTTTLTIAGNRKFESTSLQRGFHCETDFGASIPRQRRIYSEMNPMATAAIG